MPTAIRLLAALCLLLALAGAASAERRVALVVGNSAYKAVPALANPANDAADVAAKLSGLGFEVVTGLDLDVAGFDRTIRSFSDKLDGADVALFYYAGHGVQAAGQNFLLPVDAAFSDVAGLKRQSVALQDVMDEMQARAGTALVFIDACRDNPLAEVVRASTRSASATRGLARVDVSAKNTLVVFATAPGKVAADGEGRNSPFTSAFLKSVDTPGLEIESAMKRVTASVLTATKGEQEPERLSRLTTEFYFVPEEAALAATPARPAVPEPTADPAAQAFDAAKSIGTPEALDAFIAAFPGTFYATLAAQMRQHLASAPSAAPAEPPTQLAADLPRASEPAAPAPVPAETPPPASARHCKRFDGGALKFIDYCASSVLAPQTGNNYGPENLREPDDGTAWCEGVPGNGIGETIVFRMGVPVRFLNIWITAGYTKSSAIFAKNNRPREIEIRTGDGIATRRTLADSAIVQMIALPRATETSWVSVTILSVYRGSKYTDTCVSYFSPAISG